MQFGAPTAGWVATEAAHRLLAGVPPQKVLDFIVLMEQHLEESM